MVTPISDSLMQLAIETARRLEKQPIKTVTIRRTDARGTQEEFRTEPEKTSIRVGIARKRLESWVIKYSQKVTGWEDFLDEMYLPTHLGADGQLYREGDVVPIHRFQYCNRKHEGVIREALQSM